MDDIHRSLFEVNCQILSPQECYKIPYEENVYFDGTVLMQYKNLRLARQVKLTKDFDERYTIWYKDWLITTDYSIYWILDMFVQCCNGYIGLVSKHFAMNYGGTPDQM